MIVNTNSGNTNIRDILIDPLISTRDFSIALKIFLSLISRSVKITIPVNDGKLDVRHLNIIYGNNNRPAKTSNSKLLENNSIDLRGI